MRKLRIMILKVVKGKRKLKQLQVVLLLLVLSICLSGIVDAQENRITIKMENVSLGNILKEIKKQSGKNILFNNNKVDKYNNETINIKNATLEEALKECLKGKNLNYKIVDNVIIVEPKAEKPNPEKPKGLFQNVKGTIIDIESNSPLIGAAVILMESNPTKGAATDLEGNYNIERVPVGRYNIQISYVGYEPAIVSEVLVTSGKEVVINAGLKQVLTQINEATIVSRFQKDKPINPLAYTSARSFSTEEANRYAGTLGDPARMVRSYAGVIPERDDRNDIVIRGNSPIGILWRLKGIEIPNPNHYGGIGLTGNTVTLLNINLLTNSDFLTGAFPAEYGNALSGVFDLKMRNGNKDKHEYWFQTGWNGFELGAEGPYSKKKEFGSFLACYRYSFLDALGKIGLNFGILPKFQDFTLKNDFNLSRNDKLTIIGLWGTSFIDLDDHTRKESDIATQYGQLIRTGSDLYLVGLTLNHRFSSNSSLNTGFSAMRNIVKTDIDTFNLKSKADAKIWNETSSENKYSFFSEFKSRTGRSNLLKAGLRWDIYDINFNQQGVNFNNQYVIIESTKGKLHLPVAYFQDEYKFTNQFSATTGVHFQYLLFNRSFALEPRLALRYRWPENMSISFGYGNHHEMQPRTVYFIQSYTPSGIQQTNKNLTFTGAHHFVISFDWLLSQDLRFKAETYYQYLYDVPIRQSLNSTFSMLNEGANFYIPSEDSLINKGKGKNYGLELTLEKFLSHNFYYMLNTSLYQSKYKGYDGVWRNTAFNGNYIFNAMAGYEFWVTKNRAFGFDLKSTYAGGKRYIPVNEAASTSKNTVYDYTQAFNWKYKDYFRTDFKIYYRQNSKKVYFEEAVDLQNVFNTKNIYYQFYIPQTKKYNTYYQSKFFPMVTFRCLF